MFRHLFAQDRAVSNGLAQIDTYLQRIGSEARLNEDHRALITQDNAFIQICAFPDHNLVAFRAFINYLPLEDSERLHALYFHLLDLSDNPETGLAYFCIMDGKEVGMAQNVIGVEVKHTISDLGYNEFTASLQAVEEVASRHAGRIADAYGAPRITG